MKSHTYIRGSRQSLLSCHPLTGNPRTTVKKGLWQNTMCPFVVSAAHSLHQVLRGNTDFNPYFSSTELNVTMHPMLTDGLVLVFGSSKPPNLAPVPSEFLTVGAQTLAFTRNSEQWQTMFPWIPLRATNILQHNWQPITRDNTWYHTRFADVMKRTNISRCLASRGCDGYASSYQTTCFVIL